MTAFIIILVIIIIAGGIVFYFMSQKSAQAAAQNPAAGQNANPNAAGTGTGKTANDGGGVITTVTDNKFGIATITTGANIAGGNAATGTQIAYLQGYRGNIGGALDWTPGLVKMTVADLNTLYSYCYAEQTGQNPSNAMFNAASAVVKKYGLPTAGTSFD